jgi:RNA polymerase sigma-70 factor (ECF subfamily)
VPLDEASDLFSHDDAQEALDKRDVTKLLAKLPDAKRKLVEDIKLDGVSIAEASARTGLSESAVKVAVHRAVKSLSDEVRKNPGGRDADR